MEAEGGMIGADSKSQDIFIRRFGTSAAERFETSQTGLGTALAYQRNLGATFLMAFLSH